jgi:hypothetical protein
MSVIVQVADAKPGATFDLQSLVTWITEAEPRTPDDAMPMFVMCKDALKNVVGGLLDFRTKRELELEKQKHLALQERDEVSGRAERLGAQADHLQKMVERYERQIVEMQERIDVLSSTRTEKQLQTLLEHQVFACLYTCKCTHTQMDSNVHAF